MGPNGEWKIMTVSIDLADWNAEPLMVESAEIEVLSKPTWHNNKWYHKLLNKLTFGLLFVPYCTYRVQARQDDVHFEPTLIDVNGVMLTPQEYSAFEKHFEKRRYLLPSSRCPDGFKLAINRCWPYTTYLAISSHFYTKQK